MPDTRIYSPYPEINVVNTLRSYTSIWLSRNNFSGMQFKSQLLKRNFLWLSFFRSVPMVFRTALYSNGQWWNSSSAAVDLYLLLNNYAVLDILPELTDANSAKPNTFLLLINELTHEPAFLQAPDYVPAKNITDRGTSKYANIVNYPANAAALKRLGSWFEYLKQNGLYDNTRIIIVSDHGADIKSDTFPPLEKFSLRQEIFNPLLLVKDFDTDFPLKTDMDFMTNADVPTLAFKDIISEPVNPFTGNLIDDAPKQGPLYITTSNKWMPNEHNVNTFKIGGNEWYTVHSDIFDTDNWQKAEQ
jgi:hypothetical protein